MPLPGDAVTRVEAFCRERTPDPADDYRIEHSTRGSAITLVERRAPWNPDDPEWSRLDIAQLRYDENAGTWSLFWRRAGGRWELCDGVGPAAEVGPLLAEVEADPDGVFWG